MASEPKEGEDRTGASHEPRECMACRGTGTVVSNLGGSPSTVTCPWCRGTGRRVADIDAQEAFRAERERDDAGESGDADKDAPDGDGAAEDTAGDDGPSAA